MELWRLLAHRHWYSLRVFGGELKLCARCAGYVTGFLTFYVLINVTGLPLFISGAVEAQPLLCFLSAVPLAYDWLTQSWGWREGNNHLRLITGAILGMGTSLFSSIGTMPYFMKLQYSMYAATTIIIFGFIGKLQAKR